MGDAAADLHSQTELSAESRTIVVAVVAGVLALVAVTVARVVAVTVASVGVWAALCNTAVAELSRAVGKA